MIGTTAGPGWPSATPPEGRPARSWELCDVTELPGVRADVRRVTAGIAHADDTAADLRDQLVLALDEMASNALRHAGDSPVSATLALTEESYLIEVTDAAASSPPVPAVGRDPSEGGLGLYLIAELATAHGWYATRAGKVVWALLPR